MFCMQKIRSGFIVPKYFQIIRSLLKDVMQTDEKDEKKSSSGSERGQWHSRH